jgi:asparagine synthetase B (glutamine-hydrolysing)
MCGVNVIIDRTLELDHTSIEKMNQAISSRGPDGSGFYVVSLADKRIFFGNTRLGIKGKEKDMHQPLVSHTGILSYN